jgi:hypothetical protein
MSRNEYILNTVGYISCETGLHSFTSGFEHRVRVRKSFPPPVPRREGEVAKSEAYSAPPSSAEIRNAWSHRTAYSYFHGVVLEV